MRTSCRGECRVFLRTGMYSRVSESNGRDVNMLNLGPVLFAATAILLVLMVARKLRAQRDETVAAAAAEMAGESADLALHNEAVDDPLRGRTRGATGRVAAAKEAERRAAEDLLTRRRKLATLVMSIVVSVCALGGSLYLILSKSYGSEEEKWAFGTIGTILGYWLNSTS